MDKPMYKTLYMTLYKIAVDNLNAWIEAFKERVAKYNEAVMSFNRSIPADPESRGQLGKLYDQLVKEWLKLTKEIREAKRKFGVKDLPNEDKLWPIVPSRLDQPDYKVHSLLANLAKNDPEVYKPNRPEGRYPNASSPKPWIPPSAKLDQPGPFIQVAPPVAPWHFPERMQATLATQMLLRGPIPPKKTKSLTTLGQTAIGLIRNHWRPVVGDVAITAAAGLAGALAAMLAKKYIDKTKSTDQMLDNQVPVAPKPVEDVSLNIPPIVPYV
jgi:hypothetical protein